MIRQNNLKKIKIYQHFYCSFYLNKGCKISGVFGINCDKPWPANCKDKICNIENGSCLKCKTGWTGIFCDTGIYIFLIS